MQDRLRLISKAALWTVLAVLALTLIFTVIHQVWKFIVEFFGLGQAVLDFPVVFVIIIIFLAMHKKWTRINRPTKFTGTRIIRAPIETVWDALFPRAREENYSSAVDRIEADPSDPMVFVSHLSPLLSPDDPDTPHRNKIKLTEVRPYTYFAYDSQVIDGTLSKFVGGASCERFFEQTPNGVKVTLIERVESISLYTFISFLWIDPWQDSLRQLASYCEGITDTSWMHKNIARLRAKESGMPVPPGDTFPILITVVTVVILLGFGLTRLGIRLPI